jgi:hypothetical protein
MLTRSKLHENAQCKTYDKSIHQGGEHGVEKISENSLRR